MKRQPTLYTAAIVSFAWLAPPMVSTVAEAQVPPEMASQARAIATTCGGDFNRFCASVRPGGGRGLACLKQHVAELSPQCRDALPAAETLKDKASQLGALPR